MHLTNAATTSDVSLMRTHIAAVSPQMIPILQQCVKTLSTHCPEARRAFPLGTKREQYDAACVAAHVAKNIADPESMRDWLKALGTHMCEHGLTSSDCNAAKGALLNALRDHSGTMWTGEHEHAFRGAFEQVFDMIIAGMPAESVRTATRMAA